MQKQPLLSDYVMALDIGTSSIRALLFDRDGEVVPGLLVQHTYALTVTHEGEVSVDADLLVSATISLIDEALQQAGEKAGQIRAVAVDTFWHSLLGVDADAKPLTAVLTWEDTRARDAVHELRQRWNEYEIHKRTGARMHASYWPAKLFWLQQSQPDLFKRAAHWFSFSDYLYTRLFGRTLSSFSMASGTGLLLTNDLKWDPELLRDLGVREDQLPPLAKDHQYLEGLIPEFAQRWPQLQNIPWFPAIGDGAAACVGSNAVSQQYWSLTIGTSSAIRVIFDRGAFAPPDALWLYLLDSKRAVLGGALSEGGNLFSWLNRLLKIPSLEETDALMAQRQPDAHGLTVLPFLSGERSPGWHSEARAVFAGMSSKSEPEDLFQAVMESLAYQLAIVYQEISSVVAVQKQPSLLCSGAALGHSQSLRHIIADTLSVPLYASNVTEASARGAALMALEGLGLQSTHGIEPYLAEPVQPDQERGAIYQRALQRQQNLYKLFLKDR